ncbi:sulfite exporter TauE/SafE family protein [uncultured Aeromicrobium sp.]|uniref:sulfite exporter TauE/SafE family protein n=1 Tax=uncultured Aeromicrobium sp. TaxID=337820 RepID=UPI0025EC6459|nr:sulfite exporter TauE/SafE family protein [uncultured Aeromicrobium sp.]
MTPLDQIITVLAGLGAGIATSSIGVASLVSFPILLALGIAPVTANSSNTVALVPAGLTGALGYRRELRGRLSLAAAVMTVSGAAAVAGALLLLRLPPDVFATLVPWLILFACLLVAVQPRISAWLRSRRPERTDDARASMTPPLAAGTAACGVYGGYFGAGQGVVMIAVLSLGLDLPLPVVSALRTLAVLASNIVATIVFVFLAPLDWQIVALLASGSIVGGYLGALIGRMLPTAVFRGLIVAAGLAVAIGYWL